MGGSLRWTVDTILSGTTSRRGGAPGVVAMATDRNANIYEGSSGRRELGKDQPMTPDSVFAIFSATKAVAGVCVMQLAEEGRIRLDDPARHYVPEIAELQVLEGFDAAGQPKTRPPRRDITIDHLMLHTAGLSYGIFNANDFRFRAARNIPSPETCSFAAFRAVLHHDPGERWLYGANIDWLGRIVEQQRGKRLGEVMKEHIFDPLEMGDTAFAMTPSMRARRATMHQRAADGQLTALPAFELPQPPDMDCGGHGLYATVGDYVKFIRMMLNDGAGPGGRVLKAETVARMCRDGLGPLSSGGWDSADPAATNAGEFFPGLDKGWAYSFMLNREDAPTGRPAGSLMWAGLANLYFWIDRKTGVGGFWATQILPFQDIASYPGFVEFETAVYRNLAR
jgi:methyl acetate hydrolase